jgi:predicted nuclease of predicted toxin-antitoxin system
VPALRRSIGYGAGIASSTLCLRFLIDNPLPPRLAELLFVAGHDAVHVRAYGMHAASDESILARALAEDRIVVSADSDFSAILAAQEADRPSFILFRQPNLLVARDYADSLLTALPMLEEDLLSGCVAVFRKSRLRVRKLPF